ncbi:hypothetical protein [Aeromonas encheleia]|uniref:Uncharacterized protein n=1 Tax=Aeromonas encheleia TaxID=73010 RepID=A0AAE9MI67_9GAMM|nr:hypothetical protein [Aeromonas encheleia]USV57978.1 hypothetical protein NHF51_01930 [Aeromonas encheleia]
MSRDDCLATAFGVSMSRAASTSRRRMSRDDCLATAFGVSMSRAASASRGRHEL